MKHAKGGEKKMDNVEKFVMEATPQEIWKEVHKKIVNTEADCHGVKVWVMLWLKHRDRREGFFKDLVRILKR